MKKKTLAALAAFLPYAVLAQEETFTVPSSVTDTIEDLESAATSYAEVILPYIAAVGLAFIGITVVYLLFKVFKRFVSGGR